MAARSSWKGFLRLSLVSVPVKAFTSTATGGGSIHLNQIHNECHNRIKYQKVCPIHGELKADQIVSGYEFAKGQFVVIDPDELDKLRSESDKAIQIDSFIEPDTLDPVYHTGRTYYLAPDGPVGEKPYLLLHEGMVEENKHAIARVVMHGKEQVVLLRPMGRMIVMTMLNYESQIKAPGQFEEEVPDEKVSPAELGLVKTLIEASTVEKLDFSKYKDTYTDKLKELIEAKVEGKEIVSPPASEEKQVINLMEALKASVAAAQKSDEKAESKAEPEPKPAAEEKPAKKMAKSTSKKSSTPRKKKTS